MTLQPGTRLGPYEIVAPIGAGGMGEVYRGRDTRLDRTVAIKILPAEYAQDAKFKIRFEREAKAISSLNDPHICALYDVGDSYLVMEYCEGQTLADRIACGALPIEQVIDYGIQIAEALDKAHRGGIVHRDLKPANIMLTESGVKLVDFGLAKRTRDGSASSSTIARATEGGNIVGTPQYMAPEVLAGREADSRSDIFGLGLVLYEMATGKRASTSADAVNEANLDRLIRACLTKDPDQRTQSAHDVAQQLRWLREGRRSWRPVLIASVAAIAVILAAWWGWRRWTAAATPIRSLVVLPLANLSAPEQEFFAAGMHEALIGQLSQIGGLRVISRTSSMRYRNQSVPEIARALNVDGVVEGSVLRSGGTVRFQIELVRARPEERQVWSETFDRNVENVLTLQSEVARAIAGAIRVRLTPEEASRFAAKRTIDPQTYDAYLKGTYYVNKLNPDDVERGIAYLNEAVERNPNDPFAYAGLALAYTTAAHGPAPTAERFQRAKTLASKALQIDETIAEAHEALGAVYAYYDFDWAGSKREFQRALKLNPNFAMAHRNYGFYLQLFGRPQEGIAELNRAKDLDPLSPLYPAELGWHYWCDGQLQKAYVESRAAVELDPKFGMGQTFFTEIAADLGHHDEAIAAGQKAWKFGLAYAYARAGRRDEARSLAAALGKNPKPIMGWGLAEVYAALGDNEEALRWLQYGVEKRFSWMPWIRRNPNWKSLQSDPRFIKLAREMNIPD